MAAADFAAVRDDQANAFRATMTWGTQTIYGTMSAPRKTLAVEEEGGYEETVFDFGAVKADFTDGTLPGQQVTVGVNGVNYFVQETQTDEAGVGVVLTLKRVS